MSTKKLKKKVVLLIMDGWGLAPADKFNAIDNAKTPNFDMLVREYPNTRLKSDGIAVGLPEGQFGTSEVNHMTIGAGRVIYQDLPKINHAIETGEFYNNATFQKSIDHAADNKSNVHLIGILSDGGIHSTTEHVFAILEMLHRNKFKQNIYLHVFTDGRDTPPKSAERFFAALDKTIAKYPDLKISVATMQGRFYLDRDRDWAKTEKAFELIYKGKGAKFSDWQSVLNMEYNQNTTDEFIGHYVINEDGKIGANDSVIFFHYRTDRLYQIVKRLLQEEIKNLNVTTFISVSEEFESVQLAFPRDKISDTLAEVISNAGLAQFHVTETEKYPHLTFFLNGEKEKEMPHEEWKMIQSNRYVKPYYNFEPSMRNYDITQDIVDAVNSDKYSFIIANLSSPDMVGHSGNYEAAIISAESVDYCLGKIYETIKEKFKDYVLMVTADHGNSDIMWDYVNNQPHTQHTTSPVPFILISDIRCKLDKRESLEDIAPTILDLMGLEKPGVMTGTSLVIVE
ncbi:MAG: 2,3-bisphosphoglycerate-independent phosphoglycerate mutase [Candidatus Dojkabacteria bacterium]